MSFYFAIIGTKDNPIFEHEFGTSKQGGDGVARFRQEARHMNQFIVHSSLDLLEEVQWGSSAMYLKTIDRFQSSYVSAFLTGTNVKFLLLSTPDAHARGAAAGGTGAAAGGIGVTGSGAGSRGSSASLMSTASFNPTTPAVEEAIKNFFLDVYDSWVKTVMNPFYLVNMPITSSVFRTKVAAAARKFL